MTEIPTLEVQVYTIAKKYIEKMAQMTLLEENWNHADYERRYLTYLKDYAQLRKLIEEKNLSLEKLEFGLEKIMTDRSSKTNNDLTDSLLAAIEEEVKINRPIILQIEERLKPHKANPSSVTLVKEMRNLFEEYFIKEK